MAFFIAAVVIVVIAFFANRDGTTWDGYRVNNAELHALWVAFWTAVWVGVGSLVLNAGFQNVGVHKHMTNGFVNNIVNLQDGNATSGHGSFGLFGGYFVVETYPRFTYYVRNDDGSYSPHFVTDNIDHDVKIFEDGTDNPRLECTVWHVDKEHGPWLSVIPNAINEHKCHDYAFHVPPGTVSRQFNVG